MEIFSEFGPHLRGLSAAFRRIADPALTCGCLHIVGGQGSGRKKSAKDAKETANSQSQRSAAQRSAGGNAGRKKAGQKRRQQLSRLAGTTVRSAAFSPAAPPRLPSPPTPKVWRQLEHRERLKGDMRLAR